MYVLEFGDLSVRDFERMYKVNVLGSVIPTQVILEGMKKKGKGRIIFVSSQVAQVTFFSL
jgi:short-subunit dehydrogenase